MQVGDRVQTLTGRHGIIRSIEPANETNWRVSAKVELENDNEWLTIPLSCLVPSPGMPSSRQDGGRITMSRKYFGMAGHLCVANACLHHLHTHVNGYCISTVGDYYPNHKRQGDTLGARETVGCGRYLETFVFKLNAVGDDVESYSEIDSNGYQTADEADAGHEAMCLKYESDQSESKAEP